MRVTKESRRTFSIISFIFSAICILFLLCACKNDFKSKVFKAYEETHKAKTVTQYIIVNYLGEEVARKEYVYDFSTGKASYKFTIIGEEAQEGVEDIDGDSFRALNEKHFCDFRVNEEKSILFATMKYNVASSLFETDSFDGDLIFAFYVENDLLNALDISYSTTNGNDVEIHTEYSY